MQMALLFPSQSFLTEFLLKEDSPLSRSRHSWSHLWFIVVIVMSLNMIHWCFVEDSNEDYDDGYNIHNGDDFDLPKLWIIWVQRFSHCRRCCWKAPATSSGKATTSLKTRRRQICTRRPTRTRCWWGRRTRPRRGSSTTRSSRPTQPQRPRPWPPRNPLSHHFLLFLVSLVVNEKMNFLRVMLMFPFTKHLTNKLNVQDFLKVTSQSWFLRWGSWLQWEVFLFKVFKCVLVAHFPTFYQERAKLASFSTW